MANAWRLLVIEDDRSYVLLLRAYLDAWAGEAIELDHVSRLGEALDRLAEGREYDAALLDLGLPDGVGLGLVERLCHAHPGLPVIVLTGLDDDSLGAQAIEAGAREYATKTRTDGRTLWSAIQNAVVRHRLELRVRESESEHRALFYENPFPVFVYDSETLRFLAVNDAAAALYGYTREQLLRMSLPDIHPAGDLERVRAGASAVLPAVARGEWRQVRADSSVIDVELVSNPIQFQHRPARLVIVSDVTEQRRAEALISGGDQRLRQLFDLSLGLMCMHGLDGRILAINPAGAAMLGATPVELLGVEIGAFFAPDSTLRDVDYLAALRRAGGHSGRLRLVGRGGVPHLLDYVARVHEQSGEPPVVMGHGIEVGD